jgi:hypothetical protein
VTAEEIEKSLAAMEERLRAIEDMEEIKKLQIEYVNCLTFANWDAIGDCFLEEAEVDLGVPEMGLIKGKHDISLFFKKVASTGHVGKEGNFVVHPLVSVKGDKAQGNWLLYMMYAHPSTGQSLFWVQGIYDCEYTRTSEGWKIGFLKFTPRILPPNPAKPPEEIVSDFARSRINK